MNVIFNFGHPLSAAAAAQVEELYPGCQVVHAPVQVDQQQPVIPQVQGLCKAAHAAHGRPDAIILPGLALAAVAVDRYFSVPQDDYPPCVAYTRVIRLASRPGVTPPVFEVAGVE